MQKRENVDMERNHGKEKKEGSNHETEMRGTGGEIMNACGGRGKKQEKKKGGEKQDGN